MEKIIIVIVAAFIGLFTNFLAIKMLFRPRRTYKIGKLRLPFTPGIVPKNRYRISSTLATMMTEDVINKDILIDALKEKDNITVKQLFENANKIDSLNDKKEFLIDSIAKYIINELINNNISKKIVSKLIENIAPSLGFLGGMLGGLETQIISKINEYIKNELSNDIRNILDKKIDEALDKNIDEVLQNKFIQPFYETLIEYMIIKLDLRQLIEKQINQLDIVQFEKMILKVLSRELRAITFLGGFLGAIIGLINVFFL